MPVPWPAMPPWTLTAGPALLTGGADGIGGGIAGRLAAAAMTFPGDDTLSGR